MLTGAQIINSIAELAKDENADLSLAPLLYKSGCFYLLSKLELNNDFAAKLQAALALNMLYVKERYRVCKPIFEQLNCSSIPYAVIKGAVLSLGAYGSVAFRSSGDIDLLITRNHVDTVKSILLENGFVQGRVTDHGIVPYTRREIIFQASLSHQTAPFVKATRNQFCPYINVDVNLDLFWGESSQKADMNFVLSKTEPTELCGVTINKLIPEMEFISLCLHHYKDMNSLYLLARSGLRLDEFCDLYFYLKQQQLDLDTLLAFTEKLKAKEYLYYCLFYVYQIFHDPVLEPYLENFRTPAGKNLLKRFGLAEEEYALWDLPFSERLLSENLPEYLISLLGAEKIEKIRLNRQMME